jgi:hypothetical protein
VWDAAGETSCPRYQVMLEQRQSFFLCKFHASSMFLFAESGAFSEEQQLQKMLFFSNRQQILHFFKSKTHHQIRLANFRSIAEVYT